MYLCIYLRRISIWTLFYIFIYVFMYLLIYDVYVYGHYACPTDFWFLMTNCLFFFVSEPIPISNNAADSPQQPDAAVDSNPEPLPSTTSAGQSPDVISNEDVLDKSDSISLPDSKLYRVLSRKRRCCLKNGWAR